MWSYPIFFSSLFLCLFYYLSLNISVAGLEASVTDTSNSISVKNAEIVLESQEDNIVN